jgi:hypothetical protein
LLKAIRFVPISSDGVWGWAARLATEAAGITVEGENKWLTIIQNASHVKAGN